VASQAYGQAALPSLAPPRSSAAGELPQPVGCCSGRPAGRIPDGPPARWWYWRLESSEIGLAGRSAPCLDAKSPPMPALRDLVRMHHPTLIQPRGPIEWRTVSCSMRQRPPVFRAEIAGQSIFPRPSGPDFGRRTLSPSIRRTDPESLHPPRISTRAGPRPAKIPRATRRYLQCAPGYRDDRRRSPRGLAPPAAGPTARGARDPGLRPVQ
jgi:hypothetical protein